jgi:hypothetical protein
LETQKWVSVGPQAPLKKNEKEKKEEEQEAEAKKKKEERNLFLATKQMLSIVTSIIL